MKEVFSAFTIFIYVITISTNASGDNIEVSLYENLVGTRALLQMVILYSSKTYVQLFDYL